MDGLGMPESTSLSRLHANLAQNVGFFPLRLRFAHFFETKPYRIP